MWQMPAGKRSIEAACALIPEIIGEWEASVTDEVYVQLDTTRSQLESEMETLTKNYFALEDPNNVDVVGTELMLEVQDESGAMLRGIIDRLDRTSSGDFVVVDYKTGRAPSDRQMPDKLVGVRFYTYLCESLLGIRPAAVHLLHLREPLRLTSPTTSDSSRGVRAQTAAVWKAIERGCDREDFRPTPSPLCKWCSFHAHCPAQGGILPDNIST